MPHLPREHSFRVLPSRAFFARTSLVFWTIILAAVAMAGEAGEPHHVTAVRFWSLGEVTRIAVETDGDFTVHSDRLENPDRIFFDLSGTKPSLGSKSMTVIPVSDRFVKQIRVAEPQRNMTRVVLDLASEAEATLSRLNNPSRLIIEIRNANAAEPSKVSDKNTTPALQPAPQKAPARRPFVAPPAPSRDALSSARAPELWPEPPAILDAQYLARNAPSAGLNSKFFAGVLHSSTIALLAKPPSSTPASVLTVVSASAAPAPIAAPAPAGPAPLPPIVATVPVTSATGALLTASPEIALPAKRNASGDRSMIRVLGLKVGRIVLDPGHGGHDTGTTGPGGLNEKDLVLDVAKRLGAMIESRMGSEVIFTRSDDTFIPLERRTEIANEAKADLFLSIHANSSTLRTAAGVETYYLNFTTSQSALEVAARENSGSQKTVYELQDLLEKIALKDKVEESHEFANRIQSSLFTFSVKTNAHARDRGVRKAPFVVLIGASMPSVLAEIGFISNPHDELAMKRLEYRDRIAEALYKGVTSYAGTLSHFQVAQRR